MLDGAGHPIVVRQHPAVPVLLEREEGRIFQIHKLLLNDRLVLALPPLDVHQAGHRRAAHRPLGRQLHQILHRGDVAGPARLQQSPRGGSQCVAVVAVELAGIRAASLVAEVVRHEVELAMVLLAGMQLLQLDAHHVAQQALRLDDGHLHIAVRIPLRHHLAQEELRQRVVQLLSGGGQRGAVELRGINSFVLQQFLVIKYWT